MNALHQLYNDSTASAEFASDAGPAPAVPALTDEQCAAVDDCAGLLDEFGAYRPTDAQRNALILQAAKAAHRRFTDEAVTGFGVLHELDARAACEQ